MQIEKAQYTAKTHPTGAYGLLSRFFVVFFAATVSLAPTATVRAQQPAQTGGRTRGAVKALAATATTTQKEGAPNQLNTVQPDTTTGAAAAAIRDEDRRCGHSYHARSFQTSECAAYHHYARLARIRDRTTRYHRPAYGPHRLW